ncbi:PREDICTED: uncharacterized protein LOC108610388 [Drosophila arizonae]|uniref:Uncharacterized protein LOC108610388 n=1 Tax=Drosophila arizonae TaxID=7263 RepID=A0ABM1NSM2_DROAR|nr:PREDICTED: uncharacterized protein LOC108610388 [Drosophila arizonae]
MTMRLNLDAILRNQMHAEPRGYDMNDIYTKGSHGLRMGQENTVDRYFSDKADVKSRVDSMMANIHRHMKTTTPPRKAVPSIPAAIAEIPPPPSVTKLATSTSKKIRRIRGGGISPMPAAKTKLPLSQVKARLNRQTQQVMRRGYTELGPKSFTNQRRIREVLLQKTVLENMLLQHKRLQRDRQTIALDIQRMRQDLDRIKTKLDTSLQALNSTRTLYTGITKNKKNMGSPFPDVNLDGPGSTRSGVSKNRSVAAKLNNITTKRQHAAAVKRRNRV